MQSIISNIEKINTIYFHRINSINSNDSFKKYQALYNILVYNGLNRFGYEIDSRLTDDNVLISQHDKNQNIDIDNNFIDTIAHVNNYIVNPKIIVNSKESSVEDKVLESISGHVVFLDSQIPDILRLTKTNKDFNFLHRISEYESYNKNLYNLDSCSGIWLDYDFSGIKTSNDVCRCFEFINNFAKLCYEENLTKEIILVTPSLYPSFRDNKPEILKMFEEEYVSYCINKLYNISLCIKDKFY